jgi:hypothetical protein
MGDRYEGYPYADYPAFWPILYQPDRAPGERVTILRAARIARAYHATAALTRTGSVLVSGCDNCNSSAYTRITPDWSRNPILNERVRPRYGTHKEPLRVLMCMYLY